MRGAVSKAGLAMAGLGAVGLSAVAGIVGVSADLATKFQSDMALVHTQAGATTGEVQTMGQALIDLAPTVGLGPDALAQDLFHLESAGFRGKTALDALKVAAEGAQVGHANLEDVTNSLDAVLVAGGSDAKDFSGSMGELNAIVGAGDMHMQDLADAMGTGILATAHTFGLSLKDVGGALATFGDNNIRGSHAANLLRMAISLMGAPSAAAGKALKGIGLGATTLANDMRSGGLTKALADLKAHLADSGKTASEQAAVLSRAFGGGRSSAGILVLLDQLSRVKSKTLEIGKTGGTFGSDWKATTETAAQQMADVKASIDAAGTALGTAFLPIISKVLTTVMPFVQGLATWVNHNQKLAAMILIVTGAVFGLLIPLGLLMAAVATIGGPILAVIGAIALIILVLTHWNQTVQIVQSVIARLGPFVQTAFAALLEFFQALVPKVAAALMAMGKQMLATLADILPKAVKAALDIGQKLIRAIADQLSHLPELAGLWFGRLLSFLLGLPAQLIPIAAA
ncbi:MAG: phage tail tape measure protein, partial [Chloroflexota bacterium]